MRVLLTKILLIFCLTAQATTYYFKASGNDAASGLDDANAWASANKFNSSVSPGDSVLFKRGDRFQGTFRPPSGTSPSDRTFIGEYGTGARPILTTFFTVVSWTPVSGDSLWETPMNVGIDLRCVTFDGAMQPMGRLPKVDDATAYVNGPGWWAIQSHTDTYGEFSLPNGGTITDWAHLTTGNWQGATAVVHNEPWVSRTYTITTHTTGTATIAISAYPGNEALHDGFGYFIQNHPATLTQDNDWYYYPNTHPTNPQKLRVFNSGSAPTAVVQCATGDDVFEITNKAWITIKGLDITGADYYGVGIMNSDSIRVEDCHLHDLGMDGVSTERDHGTGASTGIEVINCYIDDLFNCGVKLFNASNNTVTGNYITDCGLTHGMGWPQVDNHAGIALASDITVANQVITNNVIKRVGQSGIVPTSSGTSSNVLVQYNSVDSACMRFADAGGMYAGVNESHFVRVWDNLFRNIIGENGGTVYPQRDQGHGFYRDNSSFSIVDISFKRNAAWNCNGFGFFPHENVQVELDSNLAFNNTYGQLGAQRDVVYGVNRDWQVRNNVFVASRNTSTYGRQRQAVLYLQSVVQNNVSEDSLGLFENNFYISPMGNDASFRTDQQHQSAGIGNEMRIRPHKLADWQSIYSMDAGSVESPWDTVDFVVNTYGADKFTNYAFTSNIAGAFYQEWYTASWQASEAGFTGGVLKLVPGSTGLYTKNFFEIGAVTANTTLSIKYKIKGSAARSGFFTLFNSSFQAIGQTSPQFVTATSWGTTATDKEVLITPLYSAGTAYLVFNSLEVNGTVYFDDFRVREATSITYTNPDSIFLVVYNDTSIVKIAPLGNKIYKTGRNETKTGNMQMQPYTAELLMFVGTNTNVLPVANAGADIVVNPPATSTGVSASGSTDSDGTIDAYFWQQLTGPSSATISNAAIVNPTISALITGTYTFEVTVTDNSGGVDKDTIQIRLNAAPTVSINGDDPRTISVDALYHNLNVTSGDVDGTITRAWTKQSGPGAGSVTGQPPSNIAAIFQSFVEGTYVIRCTVTDNDGATAYDEVTINVVVVCPKITAIYKPYINSLNGGEQEGGGDKMRFFDGNYDPRNGVNGTSSDAALTGNPLPDRFLGSYFDTLRGAWYDVSLKATYTFQMIYLYENGYSTDSVYILASAHDTAWNVWDTIVKFKGTYDTSAWHGFEVSGSYRKLRLVFKNHNDVDGRPADIREIVLYGCLTSAAPPVPTYAYTGTRLPKKTMGEMIGINSFDEIPIEHFKPFNEVRLYKTLIWFDSSYYSTYPNKVYQWNIFNLPQWQQMRYYTQAFKDAGKKINIPIYYNPQYLITQGEPLKGRRTDSTRMDSWNPLSYKNEGRFWWTIAAMHGSTEVDTNDIDIIGVPKYSGINTMTTYANGNEEDYPGQGIYGYFNAIQVAAMASAAVDGHRGAMGARHGLKNADVNSKLRMTATTKEDTTRWADIIYATKMMRGVDTNIFKGGIEAHQYITNIPMHPLATLRDTSRGMTPEEYGWRAKLAAERDFVYRLDSTIEYIIGEWNWSRYRGNEFHVPIVPGMDSMTVQGIMICSGLMAHLFAGIDGSYIYWIRNSAPEGGPDVFSSMGLMTGNLGDLVRFKVYNYPAAMAYMLKNYVADSIRSESGNIWVYKMRHKTATDSIAYWIKQPTLTGAAAINNHTISLGGVTGRTRQVLVDGLTEHGTHTYKHTNSGGTLTLNVTEEPRLVFAKEGSFAANAAPVVNAGVDKILTLPSNFVQITGSSATDAEGGALTLSWSRVSGPTTYSINNSAIVNPTFSGLVAGTYVFRLTATDDIGATTTDDVTILVNPIIATEQSPILKVPGKVIIF